MASDSATPRNEFFKQVLSHLSTLSTYTLLLALPKGRHV